jgi:osmotically-inducible protein OsmY
MRKRTLAWIAFVGLACGCSNQDSEGLTRVCYKVAERGEDMTGGHHSKVATSLRALRGSASNSALDCRVALRLHWDKALADADIRVSVPSPGVVKLEGTITNQMQRGRALDLAKTTNGVEDVQDGLELKSEPTLPNQ